MKKLIKNEICGSVNSAYMHCSLQKVNICGYCSLNSNRNTPKSVKKKKKKKKKNKMQLGNADLESKHTHYTIPSLQHIANYKALHTATSFYYHHLETNRYLPSVTKIKT